MKHFFDWCEETGTGAEQPWLILGKGPSFSEKDRFGLTPYRTLALRRSPDRLMHEGV